MASKTIAKSNAVVKMKRFREILEDDYNFDAIKELISLYHKIVRSRLKVQIKFKMQFDMLTQIIQYAYPKLKSEEIRGDTGDKILFNIQIAGPQPTIQGQPQVIAPNSTIDIPTTVQPDGSYRVSIDDIK